MAYGFERPSIIQRQAIPAFVQNDRDIIAQAQSGTGKTATAEQAEEVHALIRSFLRERFGGEAADAMRIQYGGSVKAENAEELFSQENIDGGLIGGAALQADSFAAIVKAAK